MKGCAHVFLRELDMNNFGYSIIQKKRLKQFFDCVNWFDNSIQSVHATSILFDLYNLFNWLSI